MFESIWTLVGTIPYAVVLAIVFGLLRNLTGWWQIAFKDKEITSFEWQQLGGTMVKYFTGIIVLLLITFGMDLPIPETLIAGGVVGLDVVASSLRNLKSVPVKR